MVHSDTVIQLKKTPQLTFLFTKIRNRETKLDEFVFYSDRLLRLLMEEALNHLPFTATEIQTHLGASFEGCDLSAPFCGVSILRAGEAMEKALRDCVPSAPIGKILIQRDENTSLPTLYYQKLPKDISSRFVLLLDPMLATGGSAIKALDVLIQAGVKQESILFCNLICCPKGVDAVAKAYPRVKMISGWMDPELNAKNYIVPGLGDFGCRYFGTN
jgi:uracil phosphoribosyltransferase